MSSHILLPTLVLGIFCSVCALAQEQKPTSAVGVEEYPIILEKGVTAGKTPVGTKIQGKLLIATLLKGKVVPRNAEFSGEVVESKAKTKTDPSHLGILMDSVTWKEGSEAVKIYLTAWYYPIATEPGQSLQYGPQQPASRTWDGQGQYPDPNSHVYRPFPGSESKDQNLPSTANPVTSDHRITMSNVQSERAADGAVILVSKHSSIKLDHFTAYVFAGSDFAIAK